MTIEHLEVLATLIPDNSICAIMSEIQFNFEQYIEFSYDLTSSNGEIHIMLESVYFDKPLHDEVKGMFVSIKEKLSYMFDSQVLFNDENILEFDENTLRKFDYGKDYFYIDAIKITISNPDKHFIIVDEI